MTRSGSIFCVAARGRDRNSITHSTRGLPAAQPARRAQMPLASSATPTKPSCRSVLRDAEFSRSPGAGAAAKTKRGAAAAAGAAAPPPPSEFQKLRATLEQLKLDMLPQDDPRVQAAREVLEEGPKSSPGNKGMFATGKSDFDPKGLRATMSASHEALNESLDANMPDHLPYPDWWKEQEEVVDWHKERGLPIPIGKTGYGTVPREGRIARW